MTLAEIKASDKDFLIPKDIAGVLRCDPYHITLQARYHPETLGFPVIVIKTRTKIPRLAFIKFMEGTLGDEDE